VGTYRFSRQNFENTQRSAMIGLKDVHEDLLIVKTPKAYKLLRHKLPPWIGRQAAVFAPRGPEAALRPHSVLGDGQCTVVA
jgi:hypothetical protein